MCSFSEPTIPLSLCLMFESITLAASTKTFLGSHPRSAQVPPKGNESIIATFHPAELHCNAETDVAVPVPMTIRSNNSCLLLLFSIIIFNLL